MKDSAHEKSTIRILVLDDESFTLKLLAHTLTGLGYTSVTTCDNGPAALERVDAAGNPPHLILGLGKQLGMEVVAEGIEDREDWDTVRRTKCDLAQGYFIARPMPAADLPDAIESWNKRMRIDS